MSLATRCTSCGTIFRVVQDQLKVSEGWVRCGRCHEVFNALEGLFDLERDSPPEWSDSRQMASVPPPMPEEEEAQDRPDPSLVDRIDEQIFGTPRRTGFGALTGLGGSDRSQKKGPDFADARFDTDVPADALGPMDLAADVATPEAPAARPEDAPTFVRQAEREERWRSPGMRRSLIALGWLLGVGLAAQAAHQFRDDLAARLPAAAPALNAWCGWLGCTIEAPRRLHDIVVESTALAKAASAEAFRLSVVLHNRAATAAAMPWVDLSLTDANGELVARRALGPQDFRAPSPTLPAGGETTLQALLSTGPLRISGYTVEIFYP
jgi:predicted Zn finger-like uncharacterized protein